MTCPFRLQGFIGSQLATRLAESVLVVPGDMFGLGKGIRTGFGYDPEKTLKGLERMEDLLRVGA